MLVLDEGPRDAPVLLLLHGFSSSSHSYDRLVPLLVASHRVVRVDLLGHGRTGGAAADAPAQADAVAGVLRDLDLTDVTVVGHSFGADVAVELAARGAPVTASVILAQAPDYTDANLPRAGVLMTQRWSPVLYRVVRPVFSGLAAAAERWPVLVRRDRTGLAAIALRDLRALDPVMFRTVLVDRRDRMAAVPLDTQVRTADVPTLVVLAGRDHFYGERSAGRYRAAGARVEVVAPSGHALPVEYPAETATFIEAFVAETHPRHP